ncbi:MAG: adenylate/guanylate cyclase domain-containing protein [Desulfobacterales bacterium]|nr:adenylate/guanylate cyclase domain-containing protein [Desulfobacterales bacterium]
MKRAKTGYRDYRSLGGKIVAGLALMAVIPYLLLLYLFFNDQINVTETFLFFLPLMLISILCGFSLLRRSADQLFFLTREIARLQSGEKNGPILIQADQELNEIASHFNSLMEKLEEMKRKNQEQATQLMVYSRDLALSYQKTKQEEALRNRLSRYVGNNLVEKLINLKDGVLLETERWEVTVLFADIRSFTAIAEQMKADEVVLMLNQYFSIMVDIIFKNNGLLDKFVGDQLIAVFGLMESDANPADNAIRTALEMQQATRALMARRDRENQVTFDVGIGINTGVAIIGNIGSSNRMDYTVIGDCVNVAARLEEMAKGKEIVVGESTFQKSACDFNFECRGDVYVKNKRDPVMCYNILYS